MSITPEELMDQLNLAPKKSKKVEVTVCLRKVMNACSTFPWVSDIMASCRETLGTKHVSKFDALLFSIVKELAANIKSCYTKPNRALVLKNVINYILLYFDLVHQDLKEEYMDDNEAYLYLMSDLLSFYLDLEIKSSSRGVYSLKKIGQSMTSTLYTHLGDSEEHLLDTLLKTKLITKSASELCVPIIVKILTESRCFIGDEHAYIRFILTFKLLYRISKSAQRQNVTTMAMSKLDPAPELIEMVKKMNHIFPVQKTANEPMTLFLLKTKFDFMKAKEEFLKATTLNQGSLIKFYAENECSTVMNLLKKNKRNMPILSPMPFSGHPHLSVMDTYTSFNGELDPSFYEMRSYKEVRKEMKEKLLQIEKAAEMQREKDQNERLKNMLKLNKDDNGEVECIGVQNKSDKNVVVITLDSDEGMRQARERAGKDANEKLCLASISPGEIRLPGDSDEERRRKNDDDELTADGYSRLLAMENEKEDMNSSGNVKVEINLNKIISVVPESAKCSIESICMGKTSTKRDGEGLSSIVQSPEHGVIDSTCNSTGSIFDGKLSKDKAYYQGSGLWDENGIEVSSSLDFSGSNAEQMNGDCRKPKESDISSTFLLNDCFEFFSKEGYKSNIPNSNEPAQTIIPRCEFSIVQTLNESDNIAEKSCSGIMDVPNFNINTNNADSLGNAQLQSTFSKQNQMENVNGKECDSERNHFNFANVNIPEPGFECILNYQDNSHAETLEQESSNGTEFNPKNLAIAFENLEHFINAPPKKVNYENVAKSYKIVKSNRLKSSSTVKSSTVSKRVPINDSSINSSSQNPYKSPPKFIKIDESSVIVNNMKFVTKNLDGQSSQIFQNDSGINLNETKLEQNSNISVAIPAAASVPPGLTLNLEGNVQKSIVNNGSQPAVTNEATVKMFKNVMANLGLPSMERANPEGSVSGLNQYIRMPKADNPAVNQSTLKVYDKTEHTNSRKRKAHAKSVIKTDINMKSILKHINPSSIPQFATETMKDNKRKYPEGLQHGEYGRCTQEGKVLRLSNNSSERKKDVRLLSPCNFLVKPNLPGDLNNFQTNCKMGTEERLTNQSCITNETFIAQSAYYDPNQDNVNASFMSASQADNTAHNSGVEFLVNNVHQFPDAYTNQMVTPYNKNLQTVNCITEPGEMRNYNIQSNALGFDGRYLGNLQIASPLEAHENSNSSNFPLISETSGINPVDPKSILKFNPGFINAPERFPIVNYKGIDVTGSNRFTLKEENGKDLKSMYKNDGNEVNNVERLDVAGCSRYENHGRASSMEVGLTFSSLRSPSKSEVNTPRDVIISETSQEELKDVDEEMREFVEPWEEPRDYLPNDEEYFKRGLPDPQNLFSEEDLMTHFDKLFPFPNLGRDTLKMEDIDFEAFDKCLSDAREQELNDSLFMSTFNENFTEENRQKLTENEAGGTEDVKNKDEEQSQRFDFSKESQSLASSEAKKNFLGRLRYRRGNVYDYFIGEAKSSLNYINNETLCIPKAVNTNHLCESVYTCTCFRCSHQRKWIRYNMLKLRAVKLRLLNGLHEADRLKSEDDELLRRIEESFKRRNASISNEISYSSLPIKKRFRSLNTTGNGSYYSSYTPPTPLKYEKFPSYPARPMISIAEVQMGILKNVGLVSNLKGRKPEVQRKPINQSTPHFKIPAPLLKPLHPSKNKADGLGKLGEATETAVLGQTNSQPKQQEQAVKCQKSPISPSETENSQPHTHTLYNLDERSLGRREEPIPVPEKDKKTESKPKKSDSSKKRKTRRRNKELNSVR